MLCVSAVLFGSLGGAQLSLSLVSSIWSGILGSRAPHAYSHIRRYNTLTFSFHHLEIAARAFGVCSVLGHWDPYSSPETAWITLADEPSVVMAW